jgi:hypothetical protein
VSKVPQFKAFPSYAFLRNASTLAQDFCTTQHAPSTGDAWVVSDRTPHARIDGKWPKKIKKILIISGTSDGIWAMRNAWAFGGQAGTRASDAEAPKCVFQELGWGYDENGKKVRGNFVGRTKQNRRAFLAGKGAGEGIVTPSRSLAPTNWL